MPSERSESKPLCGSGGGGAVAAPFRFYSGLKNADI